MRFSSGTVKSATTQIVSAKLFPPDWINNGPFDEGSENFLFPDRTGTDPIKLLFSGVVVTIEESFFIYI